VTHPRASATSVRLRLAQGNPDASSFLASRHARGIPAAGACDWPALPRSVGTARPLASAARAGPPAPTAGSSGGRDHTGGRSGPSPRIARTRRPAPRPPPPLRRPKGFTSPPAHAILEPVIRSFAPPQPGDQEARDATPGLHPQNPCLACHTPRHLRNPPGGHLRWVTSGEHSPGVFRERLSASPSVRPSGSPTSRGEFSTAWTATISGAA
jgi:hypothetical protein